MRAENVSEGTKQRWLEKTKNGRVQGLDRRKQGHLKMTVSLMLVQRTSAERQAELNHLAQRLRKAHLDQDQCVVSTPEDLGTGLKRLTTGWKVNRWKKNGRRGICCGSSELREPMTILIEYWDLSTSFLDSGSTVVDFSLQDGLMDN